MSPFDADRIDIGFIASPREGVETVPVGSEAILVRGDGVALHQLNESGALVWSCLDGAGTVAEIARDISDALGAPLEIVEAQVLDLVQDFGKEGLLAGVEPAKPDPEPAEDEVADPRFVGEPPSY